MGIARIGDSVNTVHPAIGDNCSRLPTLTTIATGSSDVFVENQPAATIGSLTAPHQFPGCSLHQTPLVSTPVSTVFINGKLAAVTGATFACSAQVLGGATTVFAGNR